MPASTRSFAILRLLNAAVMCRAVSPFLFCSPMEHFAEMSILAIPACPYLADV